MHFPDSDNDDDDIAELADSGSPNRSESPRSHQSAKISANYGSGSSDGEVDDQEKAQVYQNYQKDIDEDHEDGKMLLFFLNFVTI